MASSIMHKKTDGTCYLCMVLHQDCGRKNNLQEHHVIYGNGKRKLSERYGLKVYLCLQHHTYDGGAEAVHRNEKIDRWLKAKAQEMFEKAFKHLSFREIFGKSYLDELGTESIGQQSCEQPRQQECGFQMMDNPLSPPEW